MLKNTLVRMSRGDAFARFVSGLEKRLRCQGSLLRVLTYHRVVGPETSPAPAPGLWSTTPDEFERQISHLAKHYHVLGMPDLLEFVRSRSPLPPRSTLITFDDGYTDFADEAWPILRRYKIPATLFVPTGFPDHPERTFWWDRLYRAICGTDEDELITPIGRFWLDSPSQRDHAYRLMASFLRSRSHNEAMLLVDDVVKQLGTPLIKSDVLGWDDLRRLAAEGVTLGAHTRTHPLMNRLPAEMACAEAIASRDDLEREIGKVLPVFAYPGGALSDAVVKGLAKADFKLGFTTQRGINDLRHSHLLRLRRINVGLRTTPMALRVQLLPWSIHMNRWQWTSH